MKKTQRKLIPAVAMLLISAIMLSTSSFAWFSMNSKVSATNMSITAKADNPFLQISLTAGRSSVSTSVVTEATATDLKLVTPLNVASNVAYYADSGAAGTKKTTNPEKFTNAASVLWGEATSSKVNDAEAANVPTKVVSPSGTHYATDVLYFSLADNSADATNLKLSAVTFEKGQNAIFKSARILLVTETGKYMTYSGRDSSIGGDPALFAAMTPGEDYQVTVYFFFDGTDADAKTSLATDLTAVTASMDFTVD